MKSRGSRAMLALPAAWIVIAAISFQFIASRSVQVPPNEALP
jgi:hypothetical protein